MILLGDCRVEADGLSFQLDGCGGDMILLGGRVDGEVGFRFNRYGSDIDHLGGWVVRRGRDKRGHGDGRGWRNTVLH